MLRFSKPRNPELDTDPKGSELRIDVEGLLRGTAEQQANPFYIVYNNQRYYGASPGDFAKTLRQQILGTPPSKFGLSALKTSVKKAAAGVTNITRRAGTSLLSAANRTRKATAAAYKSTKESTLSRLSSARTTFSQQLANTRSRASVSATAAKRKALTDLGYFGTSKVPRTRKAPRTGSVAANLNPSAAPPAPPSQNTAGDLVPPQ